MTSQSTPLGILGLILAVFIVLTTLMSAAVLFVLTHPTQLVVSSESLNALAAWAAFLAAWLTLALLVAAIWAGLRVGQQVQLTARQITLMEQANRDALAPLLEIVNVGFSPQGDVILLVVSAGAGSAVEPRFRVWTVPFDTRPERPYAKSEPPNLRTTPPHYLITTGAFPPSPNGRPVRDIRSATAPAAWLGDAGSLVIVDYDYRGVRETSRTEHGWLMWAERNDDGTAGVAAAAEVVPAPRPQG